MAKATGGAGRYRGALSVGGGLALNMTPGEFEKKRAQFEADQYYSQVRGTGSYEEERASLLKSAVDSGREDKIFVWDANGRLQAATAWNRYGNTLYVGLLGSRGGGAGSKIMRQLFETVVRENMDGLGLTALERARPFYHKMGLYTNYNFGGNMGINRAEIIEQLRRMK